MFTRFFVHVYVDGVVKRISRSKMGCLRWVGEMESWGTVLGLTKAGVRE